MATLKLHPEFLNKNGRREFAVLPYAEFVKLQEELEDLADIRALDEARAEEGEKPGIPLAEVRRRLDAKFRKPLRPKSASPSRSRS